MRKDERKFVEKIDQNIIGARVHNQGLIQIPTMDLELLIAIIRRQAKVIEKAKSQRDEYAASYYGDSGAGVYFDDEDNQELDAIE